MRGFTIMPDPNYPKTGFKKFECLDCHKNVVICGKIIHHAPLRWVTNGICRTVSCRMENIKIATRIEYINPKTYKIETYVEGDDE